MTTRAVEQVDDWDARPFSGGYAALHDLADEEFSGIVAAGPTRLCMTSGKVIGVLDGTIDDFVDASGTAYEAPSPALPLLAVMQDRSDEVRAQYYTEETAIEEVDRTLTQGNFTGFVELSENVLSGDYYLVYHQGRSMSVAWVGASDNLLIEDEAFEQANDEVGIYEVRPVDIEVLEIPEPTGAAAGGGADPDDGTSATETEGAESSATEAAATASSAEVDAADSEADDATDDPASTDSAGADASDADTDDADTVDEGAPETADPEEVHVADAEASDGADERAAEPEPAAESDPATADESGDPTAESRADAQSGRDDGNEHRASSGRRTDQQPRQEPTGTQEPTRTQEQSTRSQQDPGARRTPERGDAGVAKSGRSGRQSRDSDAASVADLETRSIPSLDPERTNEPGSDQADRAGPSPAAGGPTPRSEADPGAATGGNPEPTPSGRVDQPEQGPAGERGAGREPEDAAAQGGRGNPQPEPAETEAAGEPAGSADPAEIEELEAKVDEREAEIEELESELETVSEERDELAAERDELEERVERLERRIDELRTEEGGESVADRERLGPGEAIQGTNLFVRYESKGEATLEAAHAGKAEASAVNANLQLQYHTQFEADDVAVDGEPFQEYLTDTIQYRFVEWVVRVLPYEIRDTGHQEALGPLYDALPQIDRADLNGAITVQYEEDGEQHRSQESFDVILRDRMGNPLLVANMNESRQPASQDMMEGLIAAGQRVGESKESLTGAFLVTSSFFEPEAMEAAADATGSGLLSRDKRESFVKLSRKDGFHLCLVEAREEKFNLSVPEI
ncbi:DUF7527 domain-containing protein [Halorientalis halophila]|uniref:DUF7527 domain-containing protein n=1 Tax=Halorientalis halophila TaxID=3108499 RepID=UPI00300BC319